MHESCSVDGCSIASTIGWWQLRQAFSVTPWFISVILSGSGNRPVVNATEWLNPLIAFTVYFETSPGGVWQSLQTATERCELVCHAR